MIPHYSKIHNRFTLNGFYYSQKALKNVAYSFIKEGLPFEKDIGNFLNNWLDNNDYMVVKTSGSTGKPKSIKLKKQAMVHSAIATGNYFKLQPGDSALHCLPTHFIAGKMMLVRAMILGLQIDVIEPSAHLPIDTNKSYDFSAMVPLQVQKNLNSLSTIKTLIIGGARVSNRLKQQLQQLKINVFETYGMTETITHIAVKLINNRSVISNQVKKSYFSTLSNILISQDSRDCLVINAPNISENQIVTNDVVKLHSETTFELLGRVDNVINSGGIKLHPEQIEEKLSPYINSRFFIASEYDEIFGEQVILVLESDSNTINTLVFNKLDKFEIPKKVYTISKFIETASGKIQRQKTIKALK